MEKQQMLLRWKGKEESWKMRGATQLVASKRCQQAEKPLGERAGLSETHK